MGIVGLDGDLGVRWAFEDACWLWWSSRFRCRLKLGHPVSWDWQTWILSAGAIFEEEGAESPVASQVGKAWWWEGDPDEGRINCWHLEITKRLVFQGEIPVCIQLALRCLILQNCQKTLVAFWASPEASRTMGFQTWIFWDAFEAFLKNIHSCSLYIFTSGTSLKWRSALNTVHFLSSFMDLHVLLFPCPKPNSEKFA